VRAKLWITHHKTNVRDEGLFSDKIELEWSSGSQENKYTFTKQ
jgi:hypothetical protein